MKKTQQKNKMKIISLLHTHKLFGPAAFSTSEILKPEIPEQLVKSFKTLKKSYYWFLSIIVINKFDMQTLRDELNIELEIPTLPCPVAPNVLDVRDQFWGGGGISADRGSCCFMYPLDPTHAHMKFHSLVWTGS